MKTFEELGLAAPLLRAVEELGFVAPMPVQEAVIPVLLSEQRDIIALAQTGTGKTATFGLPLLQKIVGLAPADPEAVTAPLPGDETIGGLRETVGGIDETVGGLVETVGDRERKQGLPHLRPGGLETGSSAAAPAAGGNRTPRAIVLSPTRELCVQIAGDLQSYAQHLPTMRIVCVYGGANIYPQIKELERGADIVVATPGRLIDLMERGVADLGTVANVVLDEADEMLNMGFSESIDRILEGVPPTRTTWLFSATMSREVQKVAQRYLKGHREIVVGSRNEGAENVNHVCYVVKAADKYRALKRLVDYHPHIYAIVFCRTRRETAEVAAGLIRDGYNAEALHGDLSQLQRDQTMLKFREHRTQLLVATDVAARGLDVEDLTHVINYGLPDDVENYTHRSGRTGRAGKNGTSLSIIHVKEKHKVRLIEKTIGKAFDMAQLPEPRDICQRQLFRVIDQLERTEVDEEQIAPFIGEVMGKLSWLSKEDIVKRLVQQEFGRFVAYYSQEKPIEAPTAEKGRKSASRSQSTSPKGERGEVSPGYARLFLNLGKKDRFYARDVINLVNRYVKGRVDIGHIELADRFSLFEVPEAEARMVISAMSKAKAADRRVVVDFDRDQASRPAKGSRRASRALSEAENTDWEESSASPRDGEAWQDRGRKSRGGASHEGRTQTKKEIRAQRNADRKAARKAEKQNRKAKQFTADDWKQFFK